MTDRFNHCAARTLLVLALVACAVRAACQETEYKMEIGGMAGGSFYMGDANWSRPFKDMRFAGAVVARQLFNPHMAVKYDFAVAGIAGDTRDFAGKFPGGGQAAFSRTLFDIGAQFEYNFLPYGTGGGYRDTRRVTPYITGGVGLTFAPAPADFVGSLNFPLGMGVKGAAIATMISLIAGGLMAASYLLFFARSLRLIPLKISTKSLRLAWRNIGYQSKIGSSSLLGELTMAVFIYIGNWQFMRYLGDSGVGAFGIACYYTPFFFMIGNAIAQSAQPIISYNYGTGHWQHIRETRRLLLRTVLAFGGCLTLLFILFPQGLVGLFVDTQSPAGEIASAGFPYLGTGIIFFIANISAIGYFQSLERIKESTLFVLMRGFILLIPCFYLLPLAFGTTGMWLAMPVTEALTSMGIYGMCRYRQGKR